MIAPAAMATTPLRSVGHRSCPITRPHPTTGAVVLQSETVKITCRNRDHACEICRRVSASTPEAPSRPRTIATQRQTVILAGSNGHGISKVGGRRSRFVPGIKQPTQILFHRLSGPTHEKPLCPPPRTGTRLMGGFKEYISPHPMSESSQSGAGV